MSAEKIVLQYLLEKLEVPAYMEVPEDPPKSYVVIEKTGSSRTNWITESTFALQSIAETMEEASELNEKVKEAMDGITTLPDISRSALNSDYNFTDTTTKHYRYQAVYDLVHF